MTTGALVVATLRFSDVDRYRLYQAQFAEVFRGSGGVVLAADEQPELLEGEAVDKVVIMRFESQEAARAFLESPDYQRISEDRRAGAETNSWLTRAFSLEGSVG